MLYLILYSMELQICYIRIAQNKFMNVFAIRTFLHIFPWRKMYLWAKSSYFLMRVKIKSCKHFITKFHKEAFCLFFVLSLDSEWPFCTSAHLFRLTRRRFGILFQNVQLSWLQIHYLTFLNWNLKNISSVRKLCSLASCPRSEFRKQLQSVRRLPAREKIHF